MAFMKRIMILGLLMVIVLPSALALPLAANAQASATIKIIKPGDRRNVELGEIPVMVEVSGVTLSDGYTWQVLIDGEPQGMVHGTLETKIVMPKPTGPHRLRAELYDRTGAVAASNEIMVIAAPTENRGVLINRGWYVPVMGLFALATVGIILLGLRLRPRVST
jgi:hypothetical protein